MAASESALFAKLNSAQGTGFQRKKRAQINAGDYCKHKKQLAFAPSVERVLFPKGQVIKPVAVSVALFLRRQEGCTTQWFPCEEN